MMNMDANRKSIGSEDEWLEQLLRADAHEHAATYLADDGFSAAVVARLPRAVALPSWRKPAVIALWAIVGVAILAALPVWFDDVFRSMAALLVGQRFRLADLVTIVALLGAVTWSALFFAARTD
jgi:hypothetical protein